ncbi:MAG: DUF2703 domain-containing protein [Actinobacteria bacterium]|nr:MAG: DUF2703 domain-containing protein [Actinomycetota bacterium]
MKIELFYFDDCPHYEKAKENLEQALKELDIEEKIELVKIDNQEMAREKKFIGSPTIRINDKDIDPLAENATSYGFTCRNYFSDKGLTGWPDVEMIKEAIKSSK